jgi:hypothetical protein
MSREPQPERNAGFLPLREFWGRNNVLSHNRNVLVGWLAASDDAVVVVLVERDDAG